MKAIGLFTSDAAVVVNVFYLLTFPLVGLAAYLVLRRLTVSPAVAIACSILYTVLPYHFVAPGGAPPAVGVLRRAARGVSRAGRGG